eukprot:gb/GECG01004312.1/.p1 GENE.gb/GECG01004312.1/~~gb/GECG01004312.1/.p1  ORF type:complete len:613 (+),score=100.60 gb/GECG01004312.1/:1-1839(+)
MERNGVAMSQLKNWIDDEVEEAGQEEEEEEDLEMDEEGDYGGSYGYQKENMDIENQTTSYTYGNAQTSELIQGLDDALGGEDEEDDIEDVDHRMMPTQPGNYERSSGKQQSSQSQQTVHEGSSPQVSSHRRDNQQPQHFESKKPKRFHFETSIPHQDDEEIAPQKSQAIPSREILQAFKLQGLTLRKQALENIVNVLHRERKPKQALEMILAGVQHQIEQESGSDTVVTSNCISEVVAQLSKNKDDFKAESLQVFSAFKVPKFEYHSVQKKFSRDHTKCSLHGNASGKVSMNRERFELIKQRLLRQPAFAAPLIKTNKSQGYIQLTPIDNLRNKTGQTCFILAMLTSPETGKYALEDMDKRVSCVFIDDSELGLAEGIFTDGSIVLVEGEYDIDGSDGGAVVEETGGIPGVFRIHTMGHPPPEMRSDTLKAMGIVDPYCIIQTPGDYKRAIDLQTRAEDAYWVIISDLHLDNPEVLGKLKHMLDVYSELRVIPSVFVLMGNFSSMPFGAHFDDATTFVRRMNEFADLIGDYQEIASTSHFILVPGPNDPGCGRVLPRRSLPHTFCKRLKHKVKNVTLATNPARYYAISYLVNCDRETNSRSGAESGFLPKMS